EAHYRAAVDLLEPLVAGYPQNPGYQASLGSALNNLAILHGARGNLAEAEKTYQRALAVATRLAQDHPDVPDHQSRLASLYHHLGLLHSRNREFAKAEAVNQLALKLHEDLMKRYPKRLEFAVNFAGTCGNQAKYLHQQDKEQEALGWYGKTIDVLTAVLK